MRGACHRPRRLRGCPDWSEPADVFRHDFANRSAIGVSKGRSGFTRGCIRPSCNVGCLCGQIMVLGRPNLLRLATDRPLSRALHRRAAVRLAGAGGDAADPRQDAEAFPVCRRCRRPGQRGLADARQPAPRISLARNPDRPDARNSARLPQARSCRPSSTRCAESASATAGCCGFLTPIAIPLMILNLFIVGYLEPLIAISIRRPSLRLEVGSPWRGHQGRGVQPARPAADPQDRPQREEGDPAPGHFHPDGRQVRGDASRRPPSAVGSCRPTIPTQSCSGWSRAG